MTPCGVDHVAVAYSYDRPAPLPGYEDNALDIAVFTLGSQFGTPVFPRAG